MLPLKEGAGDIKIKAEFPEGKGGGTSPEIKTIRYESFYNKYKIDVKFNFIEGAFSKEVKTGDATSGIILGDGENCTFTLNIANKYAAGNISSVSYAPKNNSIVETRENSKANGTRETVKTRCVDSGGEIGDFTVEKTTASQGLMYLTKDEHTANTWTVGHGFDYYKELDKSGNDLQNGNFLNDYYMIERELMVNNKYFTIPHPTKSFTSLEGGLFRATSSIKKDFCITSKKEANAFVDLISNHILAIM